MIDILIYWYIDILIYWYRWIFMIKFAISIYHSWEINRSNNPSIFFGSWVRKFGETIAVGCAKKVALFPRILSMDWFKGQMLQKNIQNFCENLWFPIDFPIFHGNIYGFFGKIDGETGVQIFPTKSKSKDFEYQWVPSSKLAGWWLMVIKPAMKNQPLLMVNG